MRGLLRGGCGPCPSPPKLTSASQLCVLSSIVSDGRRCIGSALASGGRGGFVSRFSLRCDGGGGACELLAVRRRCAAARRGCGNGCRCCVFLLNCVHLLDGAGNIGLHGGLRGAGMRMRRRGDAAESGELSASVREVRRAPAGRGGRQRCLLQIANGRAMRERREWSSCRGGRRGERCGRRTTSLLCAELGSLRTRATAGGEGTQHSNDRRRNTRRRLTTTRAAVPMRSNFRHESHGIRGAS